MSIESKHRNMAESAEFKKLVTGRWVISLVLTLLMLGTYMSYLLVITYRKELLALEVSKNITLGLPIGLGIIIMAWLTTGIYVFWANKKYDKTVEELRSKLK